MVRIADAEGESKLPGLRRHIKSTALWLSTLLATLAAAPAAVHAELLLRIEVPDSVSIMLDGETVATGSVTLELEAGEHELVLVAPDGRRKVVQIYSPAGWSVLKRIRMRPVQRLAGPMAAARFGEDWRNRTLGSALYTNEGRRMGQPLPASTA